MQSTPPPTLDGFLEQAWTEIVRGVNDARHGFHQPVVATVGPDGSIYFAAAPQVVGFLPASVIRLSEILPPPPPDETPGPGALWLLGPGGRWCS